MRRIFLLLLLLSAACNAVSAPPPTATVAPTDTPTITLTPSNTPTASLIPPTETPSLTPSLTLTPTETATFTPVPTATNAPGQTTGFVSDQWQTLSLPSDIAARLQSPMIAFINTNNRTGASQATPQPGNDIETLYYVSPTNSASRIPVMEFDSSTAQQIFIAPTGDIFAYLETKGTINTTGLYIADFNVPGGGLTTRILPIRSLTQRGIYNAPVWSPDGSTMAIALATGYDIDIFTVARDGSNPTDLTREGSYDFWPVWSPDGSYLAFVSDRAKCPSWIPGEAGTCDGTDTPPPTGGNVFVMDMGTKQVRQLSDQWVTEPPKWANPRTVVFSSGDPLFGDAEHAIYAADVVSGDARKLTLNNNDVPLKLSESWSPSGQEVIFQAAGTTSDLVLASPNGQEIGRISDLAFARYGMMAAWSPDGTHIAIGGISGQCPYGVVVVDSNLNSVSRSNPPPTMCDPVYSPDSRFLAFSGINPKVDGRSDIYVANPNGLSLVNLTGSLRGQIDLIGWVGGR